MGRISGLRALTTETQRKTNGAGKVPLHWSINGMNKPYRFFRISMMILINSTIIILINFFMQFSSFVVCRAMPSPIFISFVFFLPGRDKSVSLTKEGFERPLLLNFYRRKYGSDL